MAALGCSPGEWTPPLEGRPSRPAWEYGRASYRSRDVVVVAPAALKETPAPAAATRDYREHIDRIKTKLSDAPAPPAAARAPKPAGAPAREAPPRPAPATPDRRLPDLSHDLDDVLAALDAIVEESFAVQKALLRLRMDQKSVDPAQDGR